MISPCPPPGQKQRTPSSYLHLLHSQAEPSSSLSFRTRWCKSGCSEPSLPFACVSRSHPPASAASTEKRLEDTSRIGQQSNVVAPRTGWDGGRGPTCLVLRSNLGPASSSEGWSRDSAQPHLQGIYPPTLTYFCCFKLIADVLTSPVIEGTQHLLQQQGN